MPYGFWQGREPLPMLTIKPLSTSTAVHMRTDSASLYKRVSVKVTLTSSLPVIWECLRFDSYKLASQERFLRSLLLDNQRDRPVFPEPGGIGIGHRAFAPQLLPLKHEVRREDRKRKAGPDDGFVHMDV